MSTALLARRAWNLVRQMGPRWVAYRLAYALRRHSGWLRRQTPVRDWSDYSLDKLTDESLAAIVAALSSSPFKTRESAARELAANSETASGVIAEVDRALLGRFCFFSGEVRDVWFPPNWHRHPVTGDEWPRVHWTSIDDEARSDVKWLWELGRFGIAYSLVRAHALTRDARYAEAFWRLVESWRDANPPNVGVHWMCGQECAFRALAWTFALLKLIEAEAATARRVELLVEMLAAHAERIETNLAYARSQKNNHAVNEALALWVIGTVFPMLRRASQWEATGRKVLEEECQRQIYSDGAYVQHSLWYHRLILDSFGWAIAWGDRSGRPFSPELRARYGQAARFLHQLADETNGAMPNYGSNDGSRLFKLDGCEPGDVRPSVALAFRVAGLGRAYEAGPWDEPVDWLSERLEAPPRPEARTELAADDGGYYTLRDGETWGFLRCCRYRDRPAQADMLHLDLWWRGHNIVADPGTYSYSGPPPWNNGLSSTRVHNTPSIDALDQMERGSRFLWFHWNHGVVLRRGTDDRAGVKFLESQHDGYSKRAGVRHCRSVSLVQGRLWVVVDDLIGSGRHRVSAQWLLPGGHVHERHANSFRIDHPAGRMTISFAEFPATVVQSAQVVVVRPTESSTLGWFSPTYQHKQPELAIHYSIDAGLPLRVVTTIALGESVTVGSIAADALSVVIDGIPSTLRCDSSRLTAA